MAKKKKSGGNAQQKISPERYVRERARKFPIVECFVNKNWKKSGEASISVVRQRPDGNFIVGLYLVDLYCMGVKDAFVIPNATDEHIKRLKKDSSGGWEPIDYNFAHNLIYGSIEFAEEGGIEPHRDFKYAEYVLEEDNDDIPLMDYDYGYKGKHLLVIGPDGKERKYLSVLHAHLGDNYDYIDPMSVDGHDSVDDIDYNDEHLSEGHAGDLPYTYQHPEFPKSLNVKHKFIVEAFYDKANYISLPDEVIDRIMALPHDEAVDDVCAIARYELGRGYTELENDGSLTTGDDQSALLHSAAILGVLGGDKALDTLLEILRMPYDMHDYFMGDIMIEEEANILYDTAGGQLDKIVSFLYEEGLSRDIQDLAYGVFARAWLEGGKKREEAVSAMRAIMKDMKEKIPQQKLWTETSAGFLAAIISDIHEESLYPDVKELYDLDLIDEGICGDYDEFVEFSATNFTNNKRYRPFDIKEMYTKIKDYTSED